MKKITILTTFMILLFAGSAFASNYACVCAGTMQNPKSCSGTTSGVQGTVKNVSKDELSDYINPYEIHNIDSFMKFGYDPNTGWTCVAK